MGPYDMMSFNDYDSIMAIGERTARAHYDELKALADSLNAIEYVPGNKFDGHSLDSIYVNSVIVTGNKKVPLKYFHNMLKKIKKHKVSISEIEDVVNHMYGSGFFKHVTYQLDDAGNDEVDVILSVEETGTGELAAGIHYDSDYQGALMVNAMFRNLLIHGSKLFVNLQLGNSMRLRTLWIMDRGPKPGFGLASDFYQFKFGYYYDSTTLTSKRSNEFTFTNYKFTAFANTTFLNQFNLRAGADLEFFSLGQNIDDPNNYKYMGFYTNMTLFGEFSFDTRNKAVYPTKGSFFKARYEYVFDLSNWTKDIFANSAIVFVNFQGNISLDRNKRFVLQPGVFAGAFLNGNDSDKGRPFQHMFGMGGVNNFQFQDNIVPFVGTEFIQLWGLYAGKARLRLQYNVYKKLYVILRDDFGFMVDVPEDVFNAKNYINGYGLTLAYSSFIGPIEVTGMSSNIAGPSVFFSVGFWF